MGNRHHGAFEVVQEAFQPGNGFGIKVVGWFVEQQHVWLFQQQTADSHTTTLTTRQVGDFRIPVRQAQRIGGAFQLAVDVMTIVRLDNLFQTALFSGQLVEVSVRLSVKRINLVEALQRANHFGYRFFNGLTHGVFKV